MKHARLRALAVAAICLVGMAPTAAGATVAGGGSGAPAVNAPGLHFGITKRACGAGSPGMATCFAVRRVPVERGTDGAEPYTISSSYAVGPDGGYTPSDLLTAYGLTSLPTSAGSGQTVAVVDAYNNPNALADLNHFDGNYGLNPETSLTFQILNQNGGTSPLPANDTAGWSVEESLDVDAVRAICPNCKILLVEANSSSTANLSAAVAAAAAAGATEISNSYGSPEGTTAWSASQKNTEISAYNFPGVVVTASTGDDGWYGWDFSNGGSSQNSPETPATVPGVVAVGGTSLILNSNGTRKTEAVWNENGPEDKQTTTHGLGQAGASGGGCSKQFSAEPWQSNMSGFASTGCGTARLAADVSALADPYTGFDSYDSYDCGAACGGAPDWATYGGTSLASPLVAAMWALAGGAQGVSYPSLSLYGHANSTTTHLYDVTSGYEAFAGVLASGGNDWCDGDDQATCAAATNTGFGTTNPNGRGKGMLACGFDSGGATVANDTQCRAVAGFDGPSGVGAPSGIGAFAPLTPTPAFSAPTAAPGVAANFSGSATDPFPGGSIVSYSWHWGDGSSDTTGASPAHTFAAAGTYTVKLTATDNYGQVGTVSHDLAVGTPVQPSIASVTPNSGPAAGGTTITITGTGFVAGSTTVAIGQGSSKPRIDATDVTVISPTQLTAVTAGPAKTGAYWVYVTTPGGTSVPAGATKYTFLAPPTMTAISPTSGPAAGGTTITITGTGFVAGSTTVAIGQGSSKPRIDATDVTVISPTQLTAVTAGPAKTGAYWVYVTTPGGTSVPAGATKYTFLAPPTMTAISPTSGPAAGGTTITITGTGFVAGSTTVAIGQGSSKPRIDATDVTVISPTQLTAVTAGPAKTGAYWVYVTTPGGTSVPAGATKYTYTR